MKTAINPPNTPLTNSSGLIDPAWYRYFVRSKAITDGFSDADVLTIGPPTTAFPNARQLQVAAGEITATDSAPNYTLGLADTAVTPGTYGDAAHVVRITLDAKGRATFAEQFALNSDNVTEGGTNLYFTQNRARSSLSSGADIDYNSTTGVIDLADDIAIDSALIDAGAAPAMAQFVMRAAGAGAFSALAYSADNIAISFDCDYDSGGFVARNATAAIIYKTGGILTFYGDGSLTSGSGFTPTARVNFYLASGKFEFFSGIASNGISATLPGPYATDAAAGGAGVASGSFYSRSDGAGGFYVMMKA